MSGGRCRAAPAAAGAAVPRGDHSWRSQLAITVGDHSWQSQPLGAAGRGRLPLHAGGSGDGMRIEPSRAISTGQLRGLPRFHLRPINVVVCHGSRARPGFEEGFPLRCVQRLSRPHLATRRCGGRHNRSTRGASLPVLSYWGERLASLKHPRQIGTELSHDVLNPAHVPL
jgi:hypothetical protein